VFDFVKMSFSTSLEPPVGMHLEGSLRSASAGVVKTHSSTIPPRPLAENGNSKTCSPDTTSLMEPWLDNMERSFPPIQSDILKSTTFDYTSLVRRPWSDDQDQKVLGPYKYYSAQSGKNMRSRLVDAFNNWLEVPSEELTIIKRVVEMLHNASLL
jgi:geranylgeranyl diphosphate synthase, type III